MTSKGCGGGHLYQGGLWGQTDLAVMRSSVIHCGLASVSPFCKMGTQQCLPHRAGVRISKTPWCQVPLSPVAAQWGCPQGMKLFQS